MEQHGSANIEENNMGLKDLLFTTAGLLKEAFPSIAEQSSVGDVTIGLAFVALNHGSQNVLAKHLENPILAKQHAPQRSLPFPQTVSVHSDKQFKKIKKYNPENVSYRKLKKCVQALAFANLVYYPSAYLPNETKNPQNMGLISSPDDSVQKLEYVFSVDNSKHYQTAFMILLDHTQYRAVIAIRGTNEMHDIFTDLSYVPQKFVCYRYYNERVGDLEEIDGFVHQGSWKSANWIFNQMKNALCEVLVKYPHYSILCCGHSLGGAIASILTLLLRNQLKSGTLQKEAYMKHKRELSDSELLSLRLQLPPIECITFAPPATMSYKLSQWSASFITTFINGGDVVPRFSPGSSENLRIEIAQSGWEEKMQRIEKDIFRRLYEYNHYFKRFNSIVEILGIPVHPTLKRIEHKGHIPAAASTAQSSVMREQQQEQSKDDMFDEVLRQELNNIKRTNEAELKATIIEEAQSPLSTPSELKFKRSDNMIFLYPAGDLHHIIEEEVEHVGAPPRAVPNEVSNSTYSSALDNILNYAVSHILSKYQAPPVAVVSQEEDEALKTEETRKPKIRTISNRKRFKIRHVDAKQFERIIIHKNMFADHRVGNYFEAFNFLLQSEELVNMHFTKHASPYMPAAINKL